MAIQSFKQDQWAAIYKGERSGKGVQADLVSVARRKLRMLNQARALNDLRVPPGNQLKALQDARAGQYAIRINDQFRICFVWSAQGPLDVEIVDYH